MEKKKKVINVLTVLFISHKSDVKIFLNWILNQYRAALVNMTDINMLAVGRCSRVMSVHAR